MWSGVAIRRLDQLVESLRLRISKSEVSRVCEALDERVDAFGTRPLEGRYAYVFLDAMMEKVRAGRRVVNKALGFRTAPMRPAARRSSR